MIFCVFFLHLDWLWFSLMVSVYCKETFFFFLMRVKTAHVSEDLQPGIVVEREDSIFIFLGLGYLTQYDPF